jgi:hypothetical protein
VDDWLPIDVPRVTALEGPWHLGLRAADPLLGRLRASLAALLPPWIEVGARGGYATGRVDLGDAVASLGPERAWQSGAAWPVQTADVDVRALHILRSGMLHTIVRGRFPAEDANDLLEPGAVESALREETADCGLGALPDGVDPSQLVRLPGTRWPPDHADEFELVMYPPVTRRTPFALRQSDSGGTLRRCLVSLANVADSLLIAELAGFISPWVQLLEGGCFEQPAELPGLSLPVFGGVQVFERRCVEIVVDRFDADEGAWSVLINLLANFSLRQGIASVEIE